MLSNQKKIEKYTRNAMQEAGILPRSLQHQQRQRNRKSRIPERLDEGEIKILQMMQTNAGTEHYVSVLQQLEQRKSSGQLNFKSLRDVKKIEQICYAQIGRRIVKVKQKDILRDFRKSNIHIRGYLMKGVLDYLQQIVKCCPDSIFILPNSDKAINFDTEDRPPELYQHLQAIQYAQIIRNVNYMIQKNIYRQKYYVKENKYPFLLPLVLFIIVTTLLMITSSYSSSQFSEIFMIITGLVISIAFILVLGFSMNFFHQKIDFIPVTQSICDEISHYFNFLNGKSPHVLQWKIGESFFWIEIKIRGIFLKRPIKNEVDEKQENVMKIKGKRKISYVGGEFDRSIIDE